MADPYESPPKDRLIHMSELVTFLVAELMRTAPVFDPNDRTKSFDELIGHTANRRLATALIDKFDARTELDTILERADLDEKLDAWFKGGEDDTDG